MPMRSAVCCACISFLVLLRLLAGRDPLAMELPWLDGSGTSCPVIIDKLLLLAEPVVLERVPLTLFASGFRHVL
ncbi:hypothetical protein AAGR22_03810 [Erwinia sp. HDF1-3R]|uniref:hypothetical protein n=1 Tax=Erwinia sp. HDF1-3R TaxID=3141543 RepID=UPI0031F5AD97